MEDIGIPRALASELLLKRVFLEGTTTLSGLINSTKLDYNVVSELFQTMQKEQVVEIKGFPLRFFDLLGRNV